MELHPGHAVWQDRLRIMTVHHENDVTCVSTNAQHKC